MTAAIFFILTEKTIQVKSKNYCIKIKSIGSNVQKKTNKITKFCINAFL